MLNLLGLSPHMQLSQMPPSAAPPTAQVHPTSASSSRSHISSVSSAEASVLEPQSVQYLPAALNAVLAEIRQLALLRVGLKEEDVQLRIQVRGRYSVLVLSNYPFLLLPFKQLNYNQSSGLLLKCCCSQALSSGIECMF